MVTHEVATKWLDGVFEDVQPHVLGCGCWTLFVALATARGDSRGVLSQPWQLPHSSWLQVAVVYMCAWLLLVGLLSLGWFVWL